MNDSAVWFACAVAILGPAGVFGLLHWLSRKQNRRDAMLRSLAVEKYAVEHNVTYVVALDQLFDYYRNELIAARIGGRKAKDEDVVMYIFVGQELSALGVRRENGVGVR